MILQETLYSARLRVATRPCRAKPPYLRAASVASIQPRLQAPRALLYSAVSMSTAEPRNMDNMSATIAARFPSSTVYCNPAVLRALQVPHEDSKTLVDRPLRHDPQEVLDEFARLQDIPGETDYSAFRDWAFAPLGDSLYDVMVPHTPFDYTEGLPSFVARAQGSCPEEIVWFVSDLKKRWATLCRVYHQSGNPDLCAQQQYPCPPVSPRSSLIPLPYPFFIPGGRFREVYYWDSLWIIKGLVASDMVDSARDAVRNLLSLVERFGFVPNGNRVYYLNRSQPPILPEAVCVIYDACQSLAEKREWLLETLPLLDAEYKGFRDCRSVSVPDPSHPNETLTLSIYNVKTDHPRPESFKEDEASFHAALAHESQGASSNRGQASGRRKAEFFGDIASGAESGWDYTSRWFENAKSGLRTIRTSKIIPCCLNSILLRNEKLLAKFHAVLAEAEECDSDGQGSQATRNSHFEASASYQRSADLRAEAIMKLLWCRKRGMWFDYDHEFGIRKDVVACSGLMPVWAGCWEGVWTSEDAQIFVQCVMTDSGLLLPGGLSATATATEEQWDYPNCWPPLVDFVVTGLQRLGEAYPKAGATEAAEEIAMRFVRSMYQGWERSRDMHEKYDANSPNGSRGGKGEYAPQTGFGWTNGVALSLLKHYMRDASIASSGRWFRK